MINSGRRSALFCISIFAVYWLQPPLPIRGLGFWFSTATLALAAFAWMITNKPNWKDNLPAIILLITIPVLVDAASQLNWKWVIFPGLFPPLKQTVLTLAALACGIFLINHLQRFEQALILSLGIFILAILILLKLPNIEINTSVEIITTASLSWIGFSYIAFRILHTLRDTWSGKHFETTLDEYITYIVFFPAFIAGPIDRVERFVKELRNPLPADIFNAGQNLAAGCFKKFVLAEALGMVALNPQNAMQITSTGWAWIALYAYAFQIYFDFSGYTDIALGLARLMGFQLPKNFNAPYLKPNLTLFWNSWHITLADWFRAYFFNPLARAFRTAKNPLPTTLAMFITQLSTMLLIGLWHGITWNFLLWGAWHGLGIFIHNRWGNFIRPYSAQWILNPLYQKASTIFGIFFTFHFVALGWVFFVLPAPDDSWHVFLRLFGF